MSVSGKSVQAFRTIAEASGELDVPTHVLRFWEGKFPQLRPLKRAGGRRHYRPEDMALLRGIRALLQEDGYQLKGVQKLLREEGISWVRERGQIGATSLAESDRLDQVQPHEVGKKAPKAAMGEVQATDQEIGPLFDNPANATDFSTTNPAAGILLRAALVKLEKAHAMLSAISKPPNSDNLYEHSA